MAKKKTKNKATSKKYSKYSVQDNKIVRGKSCPKCGDGIFLGIHKDRMHCGKCHYVEVSSKR